MTIQDIKKALENCSDWDTCLKCPYFNNGNRNCSDKMQLDALNLITEQEKEIERLKEETSNIRKETAKEIYEKTKEKDSYLLAWEYGEGYLDCLKNLEEVINEYDAEVEDETI